MSGWKQKLRFFGGPLDGEFREVDEGQKTCEIDRLVEDGDVFAPCDEGLMPPPGKVTYERFVYERAYYRMQYREGGCGRAWPHMIIMGEGRQGAEIAVENCIKMLFDELFGDVSRQIL